LLVRHGAPYICDAGSPRVFKVKSSGANDQSLKSIKFSSPALEAAY